MKNLSNKITGVTFEIKGNYQGKTENLKTEIRNNMFFYNLVPPAWDRLVSVGHIWQRVLRLCKQIKL